LISCAPALKDYYPDSFFTQDGIYENRPLGFMLVFRGNWKIATDPAVMEKNSIAFARKLQESGAELLFVGSTSEQTQGVRGIAVNLNTPAEEYARQIQSINAASVSKDMGVTSMLVNGMPMARWDYMVKDYRFAEFVVQLDTYDVRIAFWSKPAVFEKFEPVYADIVSSLSLIGRF
jgi:hypothetical protein